MIDMNTPAAGIGHNSALEPVDLMEKARDETKTALDPLRPRLDVLLASEARAKIEDEEHAKSITDLIIMFSTHQDRIGRAHDDVKEPYLSAGRVVDGLSNELWDKCGEAKKRLSAMLTAWQQSERDRIAKARAAEREAMKDDPEPSYVPHSHADDRTVSTRSDLGAKATLKADIEIESVDVKKLPKSFLERPNVLRAIEKEAKAFIKGGGKLNGVVTTATSSTKVRKGG